MNKNLENGVIKSEPKKWTLYDIDRLRQYKEYGISNESIAELLERTPTSISIKLKRLTKTSQTYNADHIEDKCEYNLKFVELINPKTILDVFAADSFYKDRDGLTVTDNDIDDRFDCEYNMDAFKLLCRMNCNGKKFDIVDLDPYGSAIDCFDLAIRIAKKGIIITLGEIGHKRWKRLDFVRRWYGINDLDSFTTNNLIKKLQEIALCHKKKITPVYIREYNRISRVWFKIETIKITEQWDKKSN